MRTVTTSCSSVLLRLMSYKTFIANFLRNKSVALQPRRISSKKLNKMASSNIRVGDILKTRVILLPHNEDRVIVCSFVCIGYQRVTDGQTDGIAVGIIALCIASNAAAL